MKLVALEVETPSSDCAETPTKAFKDPVTPSTSLECKPQPPVFVSTGRGVKRRFQSYGDETQAEQESKKKKRCPALGSRVSRKALDNDFTPRRSGRIRNRVNQELYRAHVLSTPLWRNGIAHNSIETECMGDSTGGHA